MLDDLLDVSRVTQGKIELRCETVDLTSLVEEALTSVRPVVEAREHHLVAKLPTEPLCVQGDPARLLQVLENLLINAAKYTPRGGKIELELERQQDAVLVRIRDNGMGIPDEMLDRIFDLFVQFDSAAKASDGGMGVGLTLVKHLMQLHGGQVAVESAGEGMGSTFSISLPLSQGLPEAETAVVEEKLTAQGGSQIVIVEDNSDARQMLKRMLELDGYQVATAPDGRQGLDTILSAKPDVAIVDLGLPELGGLEVARQVRTRSGEHRPYLIALTGYGQEKDHQAVMEAGFDKHLIKPVNAQELERVLKSRPKPR